MRNPYLSIDGRTRGRAPPRATIYTDRKDLGGRSYSITRQTSGRVVKNYRDGVSVIGLR